MIESKETEIGFSDTTNNPSPKNEVKISPMMTSTYKCERSDKNNIAIAARPPETKAPKANGSHII